MLISKVIVGGVESHRTQSGVGRVGTNSLAWGISFKVLTTFETSSALGVMVWVADKNWS